MDEEFKVRFVVDMGDTEKRVKRLKKDLTSIEDHEIHFSSNLGDINKEANSVFQNLRQTMSKVNQNWIWSDLKKQEYSQFFKDMETTATKAFQNMENKYSKLAQDLAGWDTKKNVLQLQLNSKEGQIEEIRHQIEEEMAKEGHIGSYQDLANMQEEYNKWTAQKGRNRKKAEDALARGDKTDYEGWMSNLRKIDQYQSQLMENMKNFKIGEPIESPDYEKIAKLREKWDEIQKETEKLDKEIAKINDNPAIENKRQQLEDLRLEYDRLSNDLQNNPLKDPLESQTLQPFVPQIENLNAGLDRSGQKIKWNTKLTEAWGKMMGRLKSRVLFSITSMLNPIRLLRNAWSGFLEQNQLTKNTLKMISLNLQRVLEPMMRKIANFLFKMAQYANVLTKAWFNIDLFDKSVLSGKATEEQIKRINNLTAGFDELNVFSEENPTLDQTQLPEVDTTDLQKWATQGWGKKVGDVLGWALEHPLESIGIMLGAKLLGGLLGKGLGALLKKGLIKLFGGEAAADGAAAGGGLLGKIFGKELYTGMNGKAVTVGKLLGGIALTAGGTALAISQAADAGKNWQDLTTGAKAGKVALVGLGSAAAGLGAIMLGASGPVGWAVAGTVALVSFTVGMAQVQDGIKSLKDEQSKLAKTEENAITANNNYMTATGNLANTMANLEYLEKQTGISGERLAAQVDAGTLSVDKMTSSQMAVYSAYLQNQEAIRQLEEAEKAKLEADKQLEIQSIRTQIALAKETKNYDEVKQSIVDAWQQGKISTEDARDLIERAMGSMSQGARETWMQEIPEAIRDGLNPKHYASGFEKLGDALSKFWNNAKKMAGDAFNAIGNWFNGLFNWNQPKYSEAVNSMYQKAKNLIDDKSKWSSYNIPRYDVGTNYVPNDQLAIVHKGEAIVPAKYNNNKTFGTNDTYLRSTLDSMNSEIASLRNLISQGIPVTGEFVQRGSDLYATVEKVRGKRGNQPLSNPSYAR